MPSSCLTSPKQPTLWIECVPPEVLLRIAKYVADRCSGLFALSLALAGPMCRNAVCEALNYSLTDDFDLHFGALVPTWVSIYHDVRRLRLCEHPPNFQLLSAPSLRVVELEDEPFQLDAFERCNANLEELILKIRYGTPPYLVCRAIANVTFDTLRLYDPWRSFFKQVDPIEFADACKGVTTLKVENYTTTNSKVVKSLGLIPSLRDLFITVEGFDISEDMRLVLRRLDHVWVSIEHPDISALTRATKAEHTQLKQLSLWTESLWEVDMALLNEAADQLRHLEELYINLHHGVERFFPTLPLLTHLTVTWKEYESEGDETHPYYKPIEGFVSKLIQGFPCLNSLRLYDVGLSEAEVTDIIKQLGDRLHTFGFSVEGQEVLPHERLRTVIRSLTRYSSNLQKLRPRWCSNGHKITWRTKRQLLLDLDHLHRRVPDAQIIAAEVCIMSMPEVDVFPWQGGPIRTQVEAFRKTVELRRCLRKMNTSGGASGLVGFATLLETGCEGLKQDRDAAVKALRKAVEYGQRGNSVVMLWRLTENDNGSTSKPSPGGALEHFLEMDRKGVATLPDFAEALYKGGDNLSPNYRAAARVFEIALEKGYVHPCATQFAKLLEEGFEDVEPDPGRAIKLYKRAIDECDDETALCNISRILINGYAGVPPKPAEARVFLEQCVKRTECPRCACNLACILRDGCDDVAQNHDEAVRLFQIAVKKDNETAMCHLGKMHYDGYGGNLSNDTEVKGTSNVAKAVELLEKAVAEGEIETAPLLLAKIYQQGYDDKLPNFERAVELCIQFMDMRGCVMLSSILTEEVDELLPDHDETIRLYERVIQDGDDHEREEALSGFLKVFLKSREL